MGPVLWVGLPCSPGHSSASKWPCPFLSLQGPPILPDKISLWAAACPAYRLSSSLSLERAFSFPSPCSICSWSLTVVSIPPNTILEMRKQAQTGEAICPRVQLMNYSVSFRPEPMWIQHLCSFQSFSPCVCITCKRYTLGNWFCSLVFGQQTRLQQHSHWRVPFWERSSYISLFYQWSENRVKKIIIIFPKNWEGLRAKLPLSHVSRQVSASFFEDKCISV